MRYVLLLFLLVPALALPCGTPCTQLGQPGYLDPDGACILTAQTARIDSFSWSSAESNTSTLILDADVACLCDEAGLCNITIGSDDAVQAWSNELAGYAYDSPPLEYGTTPIMLNCTCNSTNVSATSNATAIDVQAQILSVTSTSIVSPGHHYLTTISVKNTGNLASNVTVYDQDFQADNCTAPLEDALSAMNSTSVLLSSLGDDGDQDSVVFNQTVACAYAGKARHHVQVCESLIGCPGVNSTSACFDVYECYDYGGTWNADLDCTGCGAGSDACSSFHCCPYSQHWENGQCCDLQERCCTTDSDCPQTFQCHDFFNHCVALSSVGETCTDLTDCQSNLHCDSNSSIPISYCTYNTSSDAGLPAGQCWDEEGWNPLDPYYGCDGCEHSSQCPSGYYCDTSYAFCRTCPSGAGSIDGICAGAPQLNCFELDQDCCSDDSNCTSLGEDYYCDTESKVCRTCPVRQDYYCPSSVCYGFDPDCCVTGGACLAGTACDTTGTCIPQAGAECSISSDCGAGTLVCQYSACSKKSVCMVQQFIHVQPSVVPRPLTIGQTLPISIQVTNPQGCPSSYRLYFTGASRYFAFFGPGTQELNVTIDPGQTRTIPARINAATLGKITLEINVVDSANPSLHDLVGLEADVQGYSANIGEVVTAPEFGQTNLALLILASICVYCLRIDS